MSEDVINKICELLDKIIEQNNGFNWNMVNALGTWITPIVVAVISYFLGQKMEKQKKTVSLANAATLNIVKEKIKLSSNDIYLYIEALITVNTKQVSEYFDISVDEAIAQLNTLRNENKIKLFSTGSNKEKWIWQANI